MWEKISQIQPLLGMSRDEMFITFQNLQLAANLSYSLLNMNIEIKISIDTDTKKLHCIGISIAMPLSEKGRSLALVPNHVERHLLGLVVIPLAWNQFDTRLRSLCRVV